MRIPKQIHFIWVGRRLMPDKNIRIMLEWAKRNLSFEILLWTDKKSGPFNNSEQFIAAYRQNLSAALSDLSHEEHRAILNRIKIKDIEEEKMADEFARYEIDRLRPNYGASSDILRYNILYNFGGVYFDSDVHPSTETLEDSSIFETDSAEHRLYIDTNSQGLGHVGNDAFITTPNNPATLEMLSKAKKNYGPESELNNLFPVESRTYSYDGNDATTQGFTKTLTILQTGPSLTQTVIRDLPKDQTTILAMNQFVDHAHDNDQSWLGVPVAKFMASEQDTVIDKINNTIYFEIERMGMLRLDDHIANFAEALNIPVKEAAPLLLEKIDTPFIQKNIDKIRCAQLTLRHPETERYYQKIGLGNAVVALFNVVGNRTPITRALKIEELKDILSKSEDLTLDPIKFRTITSTVSDGLSVFSRLLSNYNSLLASANETLKQNDNASKYLQFLKSNLDTYQDLKNLHGFPPQLANQIDKLANEVTDLQKQTKDTRVRIDIDSKVKKYKEDDAYHKIKY